MIQIKHQTARSVQSDLDLCRPQKYLYLPMALKELICSLKDELFKWDMTDFQEPVHML